MSHIFVLCDSCLKIVDWNKASERLLGWSRKEVLGKSFADILVGGGKRFREFLESLSRKPRGFVSLMLKTRAGETARFQLQVSRLDEGKEGVFYAVFGVPERKGSSPLDIVHLMLEAIYPEAALLADEKWRILDCNEATISVYGKCIGRFCREYLPSYEDWRRALFHAEEGLRKEDKFSLRVKLKTESGAIIPAQVTGTRLNFLDAVFLLVRDLSHEEELRLTQEHLQDRLRAMGWRLLEFERRERSRIATELHDELAQKLTLLRWKVASVKQHPPPPEEFAHICDQVIQGIDGLLDDVGRIVTKLRTPPLADLTFMEALEQRVRFIEEAFGLTCRLESEGCIPDLKGVLRSVAFYIAQEAILNAVRHASATQIRIHLKTTEKELIITVQDDGIGMTECQLKKALQSPGIQGMFSRAAEVGGHINIQSEEGRGTRVTLVLPLK